MTLTALSGCLSPVETARGTIRDGGSTAEDDGDSAAEERGYVRPDGDPDHVPAPLECSGDQFERQWIGYSEADLQFGDAAGFSIRIDELSFEYGETAEIVLENTAAETGGTGNKNNYNLEIYTEAGWQEVRGWTKQPRGYTDEAYGHEPGSGFKWVIELTEDGIVAASTHEDALTVCPALQTGRYRFTFWSLIGADAICVEFDLQRER